MDLGLSGRKAFVTGGARGIGASISRVLAAEGAEVFVGYQRSSAGPELAAEIGGTAVQLDVADPDSARAAIEGAGPLDILVNNAGLDDMAFFTELTPGRWRPQLAVNLEGAGAGGLSAAARLVHHGYRTLVSASKLSGELVIGGSIQTVRTDRQ